MSNAAIHQRRLHTLLLLQNLLDLREASSPFTLLLDSIEQTAKPLIREYLRRAQVSKVKTVFVAYDTVRPPPNVDVFVSARRKELSQLSDGITKSTSPSQKTLIVIDAICPRDASSSSGLASFLSSLIKPRTSLLAVYHLDVPVSLPAFVSYMPNPLTLVRYLATTVMTVHALAHVIARQHAADKSNPEPSFGLTEELEGVICGLGGNDPLGIVIEMEHRRKSGRSVVETFFLPTQGEGSAMSRKPILLDDYPPYRETSEDDKLGVDGGISDTTFELRLTDKQRRDREGVILPYFDAQKDGGGVGGRILYDLGAEDDFDEEEDEI